jgi:hypothetical protein
MPAITSPADHRKAILELARMAENKYSILLSAFSNEIASKKVESSQLALSPKSDLSSGSLVETFVVMYSVRRQYNIEAPAFVDVVIRGVVDSDDPRFSPFEIGVAIARLKEMLSVNVGIEFHAETGPASKERNQISFANKRETSTASPARLGLLRELKAKSDAALASGMKVFSLDEINAEVSKLRGNDRSDP